jgi:hypothetical protein
MSSPKKVRVAIRDVGAMRARQGLGSGYETFNDIKAPYLPKLTRFLWEIAAIRSPGGTASS